MKCERRLLTENWKFALTPVETQCPPEDAGAYLPVRIPHDWLISDAARFYEDGCGWYRRPLFLSETPDPARERVLLQFDGVYMDCTVFVNGRRAGDWKYGYTAFELDVTGLLRAGENELLVQVRYRCPNSRWYSGAGIYRNVWLRICRGAYLVTDGTYVHTEARGEGFILTAGTEAVFPGAAFPESMQEAEAQSTPAYSENLQPGKSGGRFRCRYALMYQGKEIVRGFGEPAFCASARNALEFFVSLEVSRPALWSPENPCCYELLVQLISADGTLYDGQRITVGFRTIRMDPDHGLFLNGEHRKLHGVCEHHDLGCLGAAFHPAAMERKFRLLKEMGVNAIRLSHNPAASEVMELADRMGFLVISEAFDMWERPKNAYDYARFFPEWEERDIKSWIRRDRNHPCLLFWSVGNEIYDTHADARGLTVTAMLKEQVRRYDPMGNAPVTLASNYMPWENAQKCAELVDAVGYNYGEAYYRRHHAEHPGWCIYGSETSSIVQSRGIYHFPLSGEILAEEDGQCSALGNSITSWGAKSVERCIAGDRDMEFSPGQFLWSGFDYIGEPTPYHTKNSYFGQLDTAGFPKDSFYIYKAEWAENAGPFVHLFPYWDFNEGQAVDVRAATNQPEVELFVNGVSRGRQKIDHVHGQKLLGDWQITYVPGEIEAVAYGADGKETARMRRSSFGESSALCLVPDRRLLHAGELCFVTVSTVDAGGRPVENASDVCRITVTGPGRLLGLDNGDSTDFDSYQSDTRRLFSGKLLAVVEPEGSGIITVRAEAAGLAPACVIIQADAGTKGREEAGRKTSGAEAGINAAEVKTEAEAETNSDTGPEINSDTDPGKYCAILEEKAVTEPRREAAGDAYCFELPDQAQSARMSAGSAGMRKSAPLPVPVRRISLRTASGRLLTPQTPALTVEALILPETADDTALIWRAVTDRGIEVNFASVRETRAEGHRHIAEVTAQGDGTFQIRCMSKSGTGNIRLISQLPCRADGFGKAFFDPYEGISAGLYADTVGEIGNGNEKGIATARDGRSGVIYENIDFGSFGSSEITLSVFALDDHAYPIEIWLGRPSDSDAAAAPGVSGMSGAAAPEVSRTSGAAAAPKVSGTSGAGAVSEASGMSGAAAAPGVSGMSGAAAPETSGTSGAAAAPKVSGTSGAGAVSEASGTSGAAAPGVSGIVSAAEGEPGASDASGRLLAVVTYQKPSVWNVYQEETFRLPERIRGIAAVSLVLHAKVHIRGFRFTRQEKAFETLSGADADRIYGDSFTRTGDAVTGIGNNVTLVYEEMNFGKQGADHVAVTGRTALPVNSIHLRFTPEGGETVLRILEFAKSSCPAGEFERQDFEIEPLCGRGKAELIFLPGSSFDFRAIRFSGSG